MSHMCELVVSVVAVGAPQDPRDVCKVICEVCNKDYTIPDVLRLHREVCCPLCVEFCVLPIVL